MLYLTKPTVKIFYFSVSNKVMYLYLMFNIATAVLKSATYTLYENLTDFKKLFLTTKQIFFYPLHFSLI